MFSSLDVWDDRADRSPASQMALDEALLLVAKLPCLRLYRWSAPAATFGYAQRIADVRLRVGALPLVRRWTGGGIVFHGADQTLALAVPAGFDICRQKAGDIYYEIHRALLRGVRGFFPNARLAEPSDCLAGPACFESPALHDLISDGVKICGGALRRSRLGVLYQGSLHIDQTDCVAAIARALAEAAGPLLQTLPVEEAATALEAEKYGSSLWNELR